MVAVCADRLANGSVQSRTPEPVQSPLRLVRIFQVRTHGTGEPVNKTRTSQALAITTRVARLTSVFHALL